MLFLWMATEFGHPQAFYELSKENSMRPVLFLLCLLPVDLTGQGFYYIRPEAVWQHETNYLGYFNVQECKDSTILRIKNNNEFNSIVDIAFCPDQNFYVNVSYMFGTWIARINPSDSSLTYLIQDPYGSTCMVCDANGVIYAASGWGVFTYDTQTGVGTALGYLGANMAGDLTFRNNELYGTTYANELIKITPSSPPTWDVVYQYPVPSDRVAYGVVTDAVSCDSFNTYITVSNALFSGITDTINEVYLIDPEAQTMNFMCETPWVAYGATAFREYLVSDCALALDLDADDSGGQAGSDWPAPALCGGGPLPVGDADALLDSDYRIDSLRLRLMQPAPDGPAEYLTADVSGAVAVAGSGTARVTVFNLGDATSADFQAVLLSARWHNTAPGLTPGQRVVEVLVFASGGRRDTAFAYLPVLPAVQTQSSQSACVGQAIDWNGEVYTADTTLCTVFTAFNGCDSTHCTSLHFFLPSLSLDTALCQGQALVWAGQTYEQPGVYRDTVLLDGCLTALQIDLVVNGPADTTQQTARLCPGQSHSVGAETFSVPGQYLVILSDWGGCDSLVLLTVEALGPPLPEIAGSGQLCAGETTVLSVQGSFAAWAWSAGGAQATLEIEQAGAYSVTVTDANGCTGADTLDVAALPALSAEWAAVPPRCAGGSDGLIEITGLSGGLPPYRLYADGTGVSDHWTLDSLSAGIWPFELVDSAGCSFGFSVVLADPPPLMAEIATLPSLAAGQTAPIVLSLNGPGPFSYLWTPPQGLSCIDCAQPLVMAPPDSLTYFLQVQNADGCTAGDSIQVRSVRQATGDIYAANIFSPNDDGDNDRFFVSADPDAVARIELLEIYDRWGELVFQRRNPAMNSEAEGWDGRQGSRHCLPGVYVWLLEYRQVNGEKRQKKGWITLVR